MDKRQKPVVSPITLFYSYAHEDELLRNELEKHLSLLRRQGLIAEWHDRQILAGDKWAADIDQHLETASIILLLISSDFLASDYCYAIEMQRALERHKRGEARVIPIILRPCDWRTSPFAHLQCLPRDSKAVTTSQNLDEAFLAIADGLRRVIGQRQIPARPLPAVEQQNRTRLLKRIRTFWIEGLLEHSLHEAVRLELHLQERPDVLVNPWRLQVPELDRAPQPLPPGTSIVQMYDEAEGELLILGEPGAGKTTLLLQLTRTLLERAEAEECHRLPVVFNLSSWAQSRQPLAAWLVEELWTKYQVPRKLGQAWIDADKVLPLLDGLDEVAENARSACVEAINAYYHHRLELGVTPLVVCCRSQEYMALPTRVNLQQAVSIQPLSDEQIEDYLQNTGGQLEALRHALRNDPELYELAHRPLMLSIFTLAYQGAVSENLPTEGTREAQMQQVFATYVERMLTRRGASRHISSGPGLHWLTFLAARMQQYHQTAFYLENLQPNWLTDRRRRLLYQLSVGLTFGLLFGLVVGLTFKPLFGLLFGPLIGLFFGLSSGLFGGLATQISPSEVLTWSWGKRRQNILSMAAIVGLTFGSFVGLTFGLRFGPLIGLLFGLFFGLFFGSLAVLILGLSTNQLDEHIRLRPNQGIWRSAQNGLVVGLLFGPLFGLLFGLLVGLTIGLTVGLFFRSLVGLTVGLSTNQLDERIRLGPNQGIWGSLRNGQVGGLGTFLQHFTLRFWLWRTHSLPWNLVAFLDEAAECLLLRKVGGGYIFVHRLLLDYFASLEKKEP